MPGDSVEANIYAFFIWRFNRRAYLCILVPGDSIAVFFCRCAGDSIAAPFIFCQNQKKLVFLILKPEKILHLPQQNS